MNKALLICVALLLVLPLVVTDHASAQGTATIEGTVKDAQTGDPLPGANILLVGTGLGASTDINGKYTIRSVPMGTYSLRISYVGYKNITTNITVQQAGTVRHDYKMTAVAVEGETIVVTAQASGQNAAINQQLASMPVMNVVSAAKIQELPDANAAESVSRLPGVSLIRTGGEGSQVVIRGLSPQYNQVTIDGVELPSDMASGNNIVSGDAGAQSTTLGSLGDRAEDLSMISSTMLNSIEVIKAITPDMDAAVLGGVVNFGMRKAAHSSPGSGEESLWMPHFEIRSQGGYNQLKNLKSDYKLVGSIEKRFLDEAFGVFFQASLERRNLSDNELGASYDLTDKDHGDAGIPDLVSLSLSDVYRDRKRLGGTLVLDYQHTGGEIGFMNFVSSSDTRTTTRTDNINRQANNVYYTANDATNKLNVISNLVSVKEDLSIIHADLKLSHSYSESNDPEDLMFNFWQNGAGLGNYGDLSKVSPSVLASLAVFNPSLANLDQIQTYHTFSRERTLTGSLDLSTAVTLSDFVTTKIKVGGMMQRRTRDYYYQQSDGSQLYGGGSAVLTAIRTAYPWMVPAGGISAVNFFDQAYSVGKFLSGDYPQPYPLDVEFMWNILPIAKRTPSAEGYRVNNLASQLNNYSGHEDRSAAYAMITVNLGEDWTLLPGVRYQNLTTNYTAMQGEAIPGGIAGQIVTAEKSHGYWLPMVHLRYKPVDWAQFHFAYTNTLNYPDYSAITPRYYVGANFIAYNNVNLKPAQSENFDLVASLHSNDLGLLSIDGFKKRIKDLIFFSQRYLSDLSAYPELPQGRKILYEFDTYINNPIAIDVWGIETEWQTHFWYLPSPFDGIVLNINYTHIFSEASYPKSSLTNTYDEEGNLVQIVNDTSYTTRLLNQPNDILNLAIGYDYEGFSARISMLYQDNIFKRPDFWMQNRVNSAKYTRWDFSAKQQLPWFGLQVYFNINNIFGENDVDVNQKTSFPASEQRYGMSTDLGLRLIF